jgi:uncharacterized membrane protein
MNDLKEYAPWNIQWTHCRKLWRANIMFLVVNLIDLLFTHRILLEFDNSVEANPLARAVVNTSGILGLYIYKIVVCLFVVYIIQVIHDQEIMHKKHPKMAHFTVGFGVCSVALVVLYTFITYFFTR